MKRFITALILLTATSASVAFEIVRSGDVIVAKDPGKYCFPLDIGQIDGALPNGSYSLIGALTSIINYEFIVTDEHRALCGVATGDFSAGFNFRQNAGYVTDSGGNKFAGAGVLYSDSVGYGWVGAAPNFRDRLLTVPSELAGIAHADNNGTQYTFRIDLPATGVYSIRLAIGDARWDQENVFVQAFDGDTLIIQAMDAGGIDLPAGVFIDSSGITRETPADWAENNRPFVYDFKTKIMRVVLGAPTAIGRISVLSHVSVSTSN